MLRLELKYNDLNWIEVKVNFLHRENVSQGPTKSKAAPFCASYSNLSEKCSLKKSWDLRGKKIGGKTRWSYFFPQPNSSIFSWTNKIFSKNGAQYQKPTYIDSYFKLERQNWRRSHCECLCSIIKLTSKTKTRLRPKQDWDQNKKKSALEVLSYFSLLKTTLIYGNFCSKFLRTIPMVSIEFWSSELPVRTSIKSKTNFSRS